MPKFKVGDHITFNMTSNVYKVVQLDDANQLYGLTRVGDVSNYIYNDPYVATDLHATLVIPTPKFKVGDVIVGIISTGDYTISKVDLVKGMYTYDKPGIVIISPFASVEVAYQLKTTVPNPLPPFSQALAGSTVGSIPPVAQNATTPPPMVKKKDEYTGKLYKVTESIVLDEVSLKSGDILKVIGQSFKYHGEYELQIYDQPNSKLVTMHPQDRYWTRLREYTAPKCICGMDSTWQANHKKPAPKHIHSNWCDVSKE